MRLSLATLVLTLFAVAASAQMIQSGPVTRGHGVVAIQGGLPGAATYGDAGSALDGKYTEIGITATGTPLCINDAPRTGPYHELCLGANALGGGLLSYNAYGTAPTLPLLCNINGVTVPCFGTFVNNPPVVITDNLTGPQTADRATLTVLTQPGISATQVYQWIICGSACAGAFSIDGIRSVAVATDASTNVTFGVAGWIVNNDTNLHPLGQAAAVAAYGVGNANGSATWGFNSLLSDHEYLTVSTDTGKFLFNEFDFNITSPHTQGGGLNLGGTWLVQPNGVNGFGVTTPWGSSLSGPSAPFAKWGNGLFLQDGCCSFGITLGTKTFTPTNDDPSLNIVMNYRDVSGNPQNITLQSGFGMLFVGGSSTYGVQTADGGGTNGLHLGKMNPFGINNPSQSIVLNYADGTGLSLNYGIRGDTNGALAFTGTAASPKYHFLGALDVTGGVYSSNGTPGVTCSGITAGTVTTLNGIITHC